MILFHRSSGQQRNVEQISRSPCTSYGRISGDCPEHLGVYRRIKSSMSLCLKTWNVIIGACIEVVLFATTQRGPDDFQQSEQVLQRTMEQIPNS